MAGFAKAEKDVKNEGRSDYVLEKQRVDGQSVLADIPCFGHSSGRCVVAPPANLEVSWARWVTVDGIRGFNSEGRARM